MQTGWAAEIIGRPDLGIVFTQFLSKFIVADCSNQDLIAQETEQRKVEQRGPIRNLLANVVRGPHDFKSILAGIEGVLVPAAIQYRPSVS
jgi:hypothetical protein